MPSPKVTNILWGLLLVGMTVMAYLPATRCGFVWDDDIHVVDNEALRSIEGLGRIWYEIGTTPQYYPLVHTTFWIEYHLWQLDPFGYHLVNVLLHALSAVLLWRTLVVIGLPGAWAAAALFALHPVHVESVAWITERKNVLSAMFYLIVAYLFLRSTLGPNDRGHGLAGRCWALFLYICALLSKTVTCSLPVALLLVLWWKRKRIGVATWCTLGVFFVCGITLGLVTVWMERHQVGAVGEQWRLSPVQRCLIAGRALWFYAGKLVWPTELAFIYPRWQIDAQVWWQYLLPAGVMVVLIGLWRGSSRIGRGPLIAVLYFITTLVPALGFFNVYPMRYSLVADHFQYLASVGLISLAAAIGSAAMVRLGRSRQSLCFAVFAGVLTTCGVLTWNQCQMYKDRETLWHTTLKRNPKAWMAHTNLGNILVSKQAYEQAIAHFRQAMNIRPNYAQARYNLGIALRLQGKLDEAIKQYQQVLQLEPEHIEARNNLGNVLAEQGQLDEAIKQFRKALQIDAHDAKTHNNLGAALESRGELDEAIQHHRRALQLRPDYIEAINNLAVALGIQGKIEESIRLYRDALVRDPEFALIHFNLGKALASKGAFDDAIGHFRQTLKIQPAHVEAHYFLGVVLDMTGQTDRAIERFRAALDLAKSQRAEKLAQRIRKRLELYQHGEPIRAVPLRDDAGTNK